MSLLTVKLNDIEHDRLRHMAAERGVSMAELVKGWIREDRGARDKAHVQCDRRIAELESALGRQVSTNKVDTSTSLGAALAETRALAVNQDEAEVAAAAEAAVQDVRSGPPYPLAPALISVPRPAFLAAKVDDCVSCGHEWHSNEDGGCKAAKGPRDRCGCKAYLDAGTPF